MILGAGVLGAPVSPGELEPLYRRLRVERAALSPDGRQVAFALRDGGSCELQLRGTDGPGSAVRIRPPSPVFAVNTLFWADAQHLVLVSEDGRILAIDPGTRRVRQLADPRSFGRAAAKAFIPPFVRVLGAPANDPLGLRVELSIPGASGGVTLELHRLDLTDGKTERLLSRSLGAGGGSILVDRQGQARLVYERDSTRRGFRHWMPGEDGGGQRLESIVAKDASRSFVLTPRTVFGERSIPLAFDADPLRLIYATNVGRDTFALRVLDLRTGRDVGSLLELDGTDVVDGGEPWLRNALVFDSRRQVLAGVRLPGAIPSAHWFDPEIAGVQSELEREFPGRTVALLEWDEARRHFLTLICSDGDPGRYFVHDREERRTIEYFRQQPEHEGRYEPTRRVEARTERGAVRAFLTSPRAASHPPPLVVWLHDGPWSERPAQFNRDAQALALMGYATVEVEYTGTPSRGRAGRDALRQGYDRLPLHDVTAVLDQLAAERAFDPARVAIVGHGFGGYVAMRAAQLEPERFRCVVSINGVTHPAELWPATLWSAAARGGAATLGANPASHEVLLTVAGEEDAAAEQALKEIKAAAARAQRRQDSAHVPPNFEAEFREWVRRSLPSADEAGVTPNSDRLACPLLLLQDEARAELTGELVVRLRRANAQAGGEVQTLKLTHGLTRLEMIQHIGGFLDRHLPESGGAR